MSRKKAQVQALPTEKASSRLVLHQNLVTWEYLDFDYQYWQLQGRNLFPRHLYFISDEKLKKGDWAMNDKYGLVKVQDTTSMANQDLMSAWSDDSMYTAKKFVFDRKDLKKVVATTNPDLWKNDCRFCKGHGHRANGWPCRECNFKGIVPKIDTDFIQAFVREEGKITEVELEYELVTCSTCHYNQGGPISPDCCGNWDEKLKLNANGAVKVFPVQETWDDFFKSLGFNPFTPEAIGYIKENYSVPKKLKS